MSEASLDQKKPSVQLHEIVQAQVQYRTRPKNNEKWIIKLTRESLGLPC